MKINSVRAILSSGAQFLFAVFLVLSASTHADDQVHANAALPNLIPRNVALSTYSARQGDIVRVAWTTTNSGSAGTFGGSFTGIYISSSTTPPSESTQPFIQVTTPQVAARSAVRQTNEITLPSNLPNGTWYIWINSDEDGFIQQTSTTDDHASSFGLTISGTRLQPNLIPTNLVMTATQARPNDSVSITFSVTNRSNIRVPASITSLRLGTSATSAFTGNVYVESFETPEIPANSVVHYDRDVVIPPGTALGNYYFWVVVDDVATSIINQSSRADDFARSSQLRVVSQITRPNLVPSEVTLSASTVRPGDQVTVVWKLANIGNANCPTNITGLHLGSSATTPGTGDVVNRKIAAPAINAGASIQMTNTVTLPANLPVGTYYFWVIADDVVDSVLDQSSRADDAARSGALAVVTVIQKPNLIPLNVGRSADFVRPSDELTVRWTMTNAGNGNCPASITAIRLGTSSNTPPAATAPTWLVQTASIPTNSVVHQTNTIPIPAGTVLGSYYVWIIADADPNSTIEQSNEADDAARSAAFNVVAVLPRPNLVPSAVTLTSASARPGEALGVVWTVENSGSGDCAPSTTGLYLGTSASTPPTTAALKAVQTPALAAGASTNHTDIITIPANTPAGTYYVWVIVDDVPNSTLNQTSKADDTARSSAFAIARATLTAPAANATVPAPPTFTWTAPGFSSAKVYLAAKANPVLGVDKVFYFNNPNGQNTYRPSLETWAAAVEELGFAENYYWTVGSATASAREIYAEFRPFKTVASVGSVSLTGGQFRVEFITPNQTEVIVQSSDNLSSWNDVTTLQTPATYSVAPAGAKRFYRAKP
ncbi:MAG TPA: CARDB domain-containing protein [Verrucomicrobiae bacterium]